MSRLLIAVALWGSVVACARASFEEARRAYDRGDYPTAIAEWRPLAERGNPAAQTSLGQMYVRGQGVPRDDAEAAHWFRRAAEQDHAPAQRLLGLAYSDGRGVPRDDAEAVRWFRRAAELGNPSGQHDLALMYLQGRGVPQDDVAMVTWLRRAALQGHAGAQSDLGFAYFEGRGVPRDEGEAVRWSRRAAEQGVALAQRNLGVAYRDGRGVPRDEAEAVRWFERGASAGDVGAMNSAGAMYLEGRGVPRDEGRAAHWFRRAAEAWDARGQRNLGLLYLSGLGVARDQAEAVRWFRRAAEQDLASAQRNLGQAYLYGEGVTRDDVEAARWFGRAAEQGDASAQNNLGFMHYVGRGVLENHTAAVVWFRRAADQGEATAQRNLGLAYRDGRGVPQDEAEAARWLQRAAEQGDAPAQLHLGQFYENGIGLARDPVLAYVWFSRAATGLSGEEATRATGERDVVGLLLTRDELTRARALVEAGQPARNQGTTPEASAVSAMSLIRGDTTSQLSKDLIPRKALFALHVEKPRISPDGRRLAYLAPVEGMLRVWVRSVGVDDDRVVTADRRHGVHGFNWQCDSAHILSLRDEDGDERWRLYQSDLSGETTRDLTPDDGVRITTVRLDCRSPEHALLDVHRRNRTGPDVYRVHLPSGVSKLDTENPGDVIEWLADADLQVRAAGTLGPTGPMIRVRSVGRSAWRALKRWSADLVGFSGGPQGLELLSSGEAPARRLLRVDMETGAVTVLAEDPQYDVADLLVHPKTGAIQAVAFIRTRREWTVIDDSIRADFEVLGKARAGIIGVASRDLEDRTWIVAYEGDDAPPEYFAYDRATRRATPLFRRPSGLEGFVMARMQPISFQTRDGMALHGYLTLPADGVRPAPLVVLVHGGPWERDVWGWDPEVQWLANRGYAVLQVNFRGSSGYGRAYLDAGDLEWGDKMLKDLLDGKAWAVREGHADPRKACIMGASYGGYATLSALTFAPGEFACGIALAAPSDLVALARSRWSLLRPFMDQRLGRLDRDEDILRARSPLFAVERLAAPLLIAHGGNDPNVSRLESDQFVTAARSRGKPVAYLVFPDEGHGLTRPANRLRFYAAVERFLAQHLGGMLEPPSPDEDWQPLTR